MERILVISPHPDDESIGCGGTIRKHVLVGDQVDVVFLTSGEMGGHGYPPEETRRIREEEAGNAASILGIHSIDFFRLPDRNLKANPKLVGMLKERLRALHPDVVYVPHPKEQHRDHRAAVRALGKTLKETEPGFPNPKILMYEIWTPIQRIDRIEDISDVIETKLNAVRAYQSQCRIMDFVQAIAGLNRYRGEMHSWPGGDYAEIFECEQVRS